MAQRARQAGLEVILDSAGTSDEETGNPPWPHACRAAVARGYVMPERRARPVRIGDYTSFDRMLAMTTRHLEILRRRAPRVATARLELFMDYAPAFGLRDVPDPWYGGPADYEHALDLIEAGVDGLLNDLLGRS